MQVISVIHQVFPTSRLWTGTSCQISSSIRLEIKCTINIMHLDHPKPIVHGKLVLLFHLVARSCLTLCNPVDCSTPGSSVHGILSARILEWVAISFSTMEKFSSTKLLPGAKKVGDCYDIPH